MIQLMTGLRMASFYGNFFNRSSDLCAFPAFPRDQGYVVEVAIDESITKPVVCLQAAILHSTCYGTAGFCCPSNGKGNDELEFLRWQSQQQLTLQMYLHQ